MTFISSLTSDDRAFLPSQLNNTKLSNKVIQWFKQRGISEDTLNKMKVSEGLEYMPQTGKKENTIQFNYFINIFLLVPTSSSKDHLEILAEVANMLSDNKFIDELRYSTSADQLHERICSWVQTDSKIAD